MTRESGIRTHLWDPEQYKINAQCVSELGLPARDLSNPKPREHVLDLGCGGGALALEIAKNDCLNLIWDNQSLRLFSTLRVR